MSLHDELKALAEAQCGTTISDRVALLTLAHDGAMTMAKLAEAIGLTAGAVTTLVDRLERQGLVIRERQNDRRKIAVKLTGLAEQRMHGAA